MVHDHLLKLSRSAAETIQVGTDKIARLMVRINNNDELEVCADGEFADGIVEFAHVSTGSKFDDDGVMLIYDGFPLVRIGADVAVGDELTAAADNSGKAVPAIATKKVSMIAKTAGVAASDFPFVRAQILRKGQYIKA